MIAIFALDRDFKDLQLSPKKHFVRIRTDDDIRGRTFTGVIEMWHWWELNNRIDRAYYVLKQRQPELFKNEK